MAKKKIVVETKYTVKGANGVEDAYEGISDSANDASNSTEKLNDNIEQTGDSSKKAKSGLGSLLDGFKAIVANPIGLTLVALVGAIRFVSNALSSSEGASNKLSQGFAYLQGFIQPLTNAILTGFESIAEAVAEPGKAWDNFVTGFENSVNYVKDNILAPYLSGWKILGLGVSAQILKMRIAWNEFTGDVEESDELQTKLDEVNESIGENVKIIQDASKTLKDDVVGAYNAVVEGVTNYIDEADKLGDALSDLVRREQQLLVVRREQEVQNAKALADIEALKIIRDDEAQSLQDRIKANEDIAKIEQTRITNAISLAQRELALVRENIALRGASTEFLDAEKDALIAVQELRSESAGIENEQIVNKTALLTEEFDKQASLIDKEQELLAIREEDAVKLAEAQVQAQRDKLIALEELGLQEKQLYTDQLNALEIAQATFIQAQKEADIEASEAKKELDEKNTADAIKLAEDTAKEKAKIEQALGNQILNFANSLSTALGEESKSALLIQKTVALAQIGIDTAKAISSLTAASSANPANAVTFGGAGAIQFATGLLQIGSNIAQAYALLKAPAPSLSSGDSGDASAPPPNTQQTAPDLGFEGRSAGSENFGAQVIKAYVTESDITTSQTNASNIQDLSQIG